MLKIEQATKLLLKLTILKLDIEDYKRSLINGTYGGITYEEAEQVLEGYKTELKVWNYITELIEKQ